MAEKLDYLDREYLSHFDRIEAVSYTNLNQGKDAKVQLSKIYAQRDNQ